MLLEQKSDPALSWQPCATLHHLRLRATILQMMRQFFYDRGILEVDTPLLGHTSTPDPHIASVPALLQLPHCQTIHRYYLQTSPEYMMKRLLAAGSGAIFQLTKAFRQGEMGRYHHPEFTMLEWYQLGLTHHQLMDEVDALLQVILKSPPAERISYAALFATHMNINPHLVSQDVLRTCAEHLGLTVHALDDRDTILQLLLAHSIEPQLGKDRPCFVYDFPVSQAALAKIITVNGQQVAARFEAYYRGIELANGFHELQDSLEQRQRLEEQLAIRRRKHLPLLPIDEYFLAALQHLPDCAGVAMGVDRLMMFITQSEHITEVMSFDLTQFSRHRTED